MNLVKLSHADGIAILRLNDGAANPISSAMLEELGILLDQVQQDYRGMVLAGGDKFFSIGLNLPELLPMNRDAFTAFYQKFSQVLWRLFTLPLPTVSAIKGHAIAGGTILALMTDYRFLAEGKSLMGVNEVKLGLTLPCLAGLSLGRILPDRQAKDMIYCGEFVRARQAHAMGLVDGLCAPDECEQAALEKVNTLAALPAPAFSAIKQNRLADLEARYRQKQEAEAALFIDLWFSPETQALLAEAAKTF